MRTGRFSSLPISPVSFTDTVRRIEREKGIKVVRFDLAEPLFPPLREAIEETVKAVESGYVHYPPPRGNPSSSRRYYPTSGGPGAWNTTPMR